MYTLLWLGACVGAAAALAGPNASDRIAWPTNDGSKPEHGTAGVCGADATDGIAAGTTHPDGAHHLSDSLAAGADGPQYPILMRPAPRRVSSAAVKASTSSSTCADYCPCSDDYNCYMASTDSSTGQCYRYGNWPSCGQPSVSCLGACPTEGYIRVDGCCVDPNDQFSDVGPVTVLENSNIVMIQSASIYAEVQAGRQGPCSSTVGEKRSSVERAVTAVLRECKDLGLDALPWPFQLINP